MPSAAWWARAERGSGARGSRRCAGSSAATPRRPSRTSTYAVLKGARHRALLSHDAGCDQRCPAALDELMTMAIELAAMERILRALMDANREEENVAGAGRLRSIRS